MLLDHNVFFDFAKYYLGVHKTIPTDFETTDAVLDDFKQFLGRDKVSLSDVEMTANLDFIKDHIQYQLVSMIYGIPDADKIKLSRDPLVLKALDSMPQAKELLAKAKRYIASQTTR